MKGLRLGLGVTAGLLFLALIVVAPQGLPDSRVFGYTADEIDLWALNSYAVELAAGPVFLLDMLFPAALAGFLLTLLPRWAFWLPFAYAALDYRENIVLRAYYDGLGAAVPLSPWASTLTQAKWISLALALAVIVWTVAGTRRQA